LTTQFILWLGQTPDDDIRWLEWSRAKSVVVREGSIEAAALPDLANIVGQQSVIALLPGELCFYTQIQLPNSRRKTVRALPYLVEDKLAQPLESVHIVSGRGRSSNLREVIAVNAEYLNERLAQLHDAAISVASLVPDYMMLPSGSDACVVRDGERVLCRTAGHAGTMNVSMFGAWWRLADRPTVARCLGTIPELEPCAEVLPIAPACNAFEFIARKSGEVTALSFLQGTYEVQSPLRNALRHLKVPLVASVLLMLSFVLHSYLGIVNLQRQITVLDQQVESTFRAALPDVQRIVNPRSQMRARLMELEKKGQQGEFLAILSVASPVLVAHKQLVIESMRFDREGGTLQLQIQLPDFQELDSLNAELQRAKLNVSPGTYRQEDKGDVSAQMTIRREAGA
jgi:general secretion pathway protein L